MKNFDSLERDLEALAAIKPDAAPENLRELQTLRELLKSAAAERRSSQHQEWAWTRCCAQMQEIPAQPSLWQLFNQNLRWLGTGAAVALAGVICLPYFSSMGDGPLPVVTSNSKTISAVPFHSPKAQADVIWVSGYNYLPASHTIR